MQVNLYLGSNLTMDQKDVAIHIRRLTLYLWLGLFQSQISYLQMVAWRILSLSPSSKFKQASLQAISSTYVSTDPRLSSLNVSRLLIFPFSLHYDGIKCGILQGFNRNTNQIYPIDNKKYADIVCPTRFWPMIYTYQTYIDVMMTLLNPISHWNVNEWERVSEAKLQGLGRTKFSAPTI